jgi:arginine deiminase
MHEPSLLSATRFTQKNIIPVQPRKYFEDMGYSVIEAEKEQSIYKQVCNIFCGGGKQVIAYNLTDVINKQLRQAGLDPNTIKGEDLVIGTGGPRCMTRPVYV